MSHVDIIDFTIKDFDALKKACDILGAEIVMNQKTYKWYGRHVGDYPIPEGFTKEDMGKCDHAIRLKADNKFRGFETYEVGLVKREDGYIPIYDFYRQGRGLEQALGQKLNKLKQEYSVEAIKNKIKAKNKHIKKMDDIRDGNKRRIEIYV